MFYYFIAKPGKKNKSRTITKNHYKQKLTQFLHERLGPRMPSPPSPIPARRADLKEKRLEEEEDFILCKLRDQEEVQDKTFDGVTGSGRASYESAEPRMPVKISPPFPIKGKEVMAKIPQKRVTYTHVPQDQEEVQGETYEDVIGSESKSYIQCKYDLASDIS